MLHAFNVVAASMRNHVIPVELDAEYTWRARELAKLCDAMSLVDADVQRKAVLHSGMQIVKHQEDEVRVDRL